MLTDQQQAAISFLNEIEEKQGYSPLLYAYNLVSESHPQNDQRDAHAILNVVNALLVIVKDEHHRLHLVINDPQALMQCERALGMPLSQKFLRVEYNPNKQSVLFGDHPEHGEFCFISFDFIAEIKRLFDCNDDAAVSYAFTQKMRGYTEHSIMRYSFGQPKTIDGEDFKGAS